MPTTWHWLGTAELRWWKSVGSVALPKPAGNLVSLTLGVVMRGTVLKAAMDANRSRPHVRQSHFRPLTLTPTLPVGAAAGLYRAAAT